MATTSSRPKAHLLRELNSTRHSSSSSKQSGSSRSSLDNFDPENEAIMSTRQLNDVAQRLPELRASAKKYSRPRFPEPEYNINTSALEKAFPDFSQATMSEDSDVSVEIGRGNDVKLQQLKQQAYEHREFSSNGDISLGDDSLTFKASSRNDAAGGQPSSRTVRTSKLSNFAHEGPKPHSQSYRSSALRNEVAPSPASKSRDYGSNDSRKSSENARRTLSAMHSKAGNESDPSFLLQDRPQTIDLTVRSTRFNPNKPFAVHEPQLPAKYRASQGLHSGRQTKSSRLSYPVTSQTTQGSFQLPEMPNVSELVSGVFEDGTPVYSRHGKSRLGRTDNGQKDSRIPNVDEVPVPIDEQAIFLSLKIMEDRVGLLEKEKSGLEVTVRELQEQNDRLMLKNRLQRKETDGSDSALGLGESDDQDEFLEARHQSQGNGKIRLASSIKSLKHQLSISERKVATTENIIRNVSQERDSAVAQLGVAFVTIEQVKAENESCKCEIQDLKTGASRAAIRPLNSAPTSSEPVKSIKKRAGDLQEARNVANKGAKAAVIPAQPRSTKIVASNAHEDIQDSDYDELFDLTPRAYKTHRDARRDPMQLQGEQDSRQDRPSNQINAQNTTQTSKWDRNVSMHPDVDHNFTTRSQDLTELSYIDTRDIESMRAALETERLRKKEAGSHQNEDIAAGSRAENGTAQQQDPTLRRSASIAYERRLRAQSSDRQRKENDKNEAAHSRRHSETSILTTRSRRQEPSQKNITSAFIIPDITIGPTKAVAFNDALAIDHSPKGDELLAEEPTVRPSQAPSLALKTVIKSFEAEILNLKKQLAKYQQQYNSHNPALSKRVRKYVFERMQTTSQIIDAKCDQLYSLYDVLEGQKQSGQELTQDEIDETLQSIGIKASDLESVDENDTVPSKLSVERKPWDLASENGAEDDLPWEGIETTIETNKTSSTRGHNRRGSRF